MGIFGNDKKKKDRDADIREQRSDEDSLRLKKEELDITKQKNKIGDVELGKEIVTERKAVDVPVTHEEVVIERRSIDNEASDSPITNEEKIHIPVMDESINVEKHTVVTGEVSARKREVPDQRHIEENLKKEEARIHTDGDPKIVNDDDGDHDDHDEEDRGIF